MPTLPVPAARRLGTTLHLTGAALALIGMARHLDPAPRRAAALRMVVHDCSQDRPASTEVEPLRSAEAHLRVGAGRSKRGRDGIAALGS